MYEWELDEMTLFVYWVIWLRGVILYIWEEWTTKMRDRNWLKQLRISRRWGHPSLLLYFGLCVLVWSNVILPKKIQVRPFRKGSSPTLLVSWPNLWMKAIGTKSTVLRSDRRSYQCRPTKVVMKIVTTIMPTLSGLPKEKEVNLQAQPINDLKDTTSKMMLNSSLNLQLKNGIVFPSTSIRRIKLWFWGRPKEECWQWLVASK